MWAWKAASEGHGLYMSLRFSRCVESCDIKDQGCPRASPNSCIIIERPREDPEDPPVGLGIPRQL